MLYVWWLVRKGNISVLCGPMHQCVWKGLVRCSVSILYFYRTRELSSRGDKFARVKSDNRTPRGFRTDAVKSIFVKKKKKNSNLTFTGNLFYRVRLRWTWAWTNGTTVEIYCNIMLSNGDDRLSAIISLFFPNPSTIALRIQTLGVIIRLQFRTQFPE